MTNEPQNLEFSSLSAGGAAIVIGASGGIGRAMSGHLGASAHFAEVIGLSRSGHSDFDLTDEESIAGAAADAAATAAALPAGIRLVIDATGLLHEEGVDPEKSWRQVEPSAMARVFAVNAIGPALLMKHFLPLLPKHGKAVFATLSAKVGSIGENNLGGWYSYRASKAALNQLVRTAAIELRRSHADAVCVALHPGTVDTRLSAPFSKAGLTVRTPEIAASDLLGVIDRLTAAHSGGFFDYRGKPLPW